MKQHTIWTRRKAFYIRFTLRSLFAVILLLAVVTTTGVWFYRSWYVPRTPLTWVPFSTTALDVAHRQRRPVLLLASGNWTASASFSLFRSYIDTPPIRRLVDRYGAVTMHADLTDEVERIDRQLKDITGRDRMPYPSVIVIPSHPANSPVVVQFPFSERAITHAIQGTAAEF